MATTTERASLFSMEVLAQWRAASAARREAEAAGDSWLADLMAGRIEDLRDLVRQSGTIDLTLACS